MVKIYPADEKMVGVRDTFRARYRFDDLQPGYCMELTDGEHDDPIDKIAAAYNAYAQYRGYKHTQQKTKTGLIIVRLS